MMTLHAVPLSAPYLEICTRHKIRPTPETGVYEAEERGAVIGFCIFTLAPQEIILDYLHTEPENDWFLMDGIIRSVVNYGVSQGRYSCSFSDRVSPEMLTRFYFDTNVTNYQMDSTELLTKHKNCGC